MITQQLGVDACMYMFNYVSYQLDRIIPLIYSKLDQTLNITEPKYSRKGDVLPPVALMQFVYMLTINTSHGYVL